MSKGYNLYNPIGFCPPSIQPDFGRSIGGRGPTGLGGSAGGGGGYPSNNGGRKEVDMDLDSDEDNGEFWKLQRMDMNIRSNFSLCESWTYQIKLKLYNVLLNSFGEVGGAVIFSLQASKLTYQWDLALVSSSSCSICIYLHYYQNLGPDRKKILAPREKATFPNQTRFLDPGPDHPQNLAKYSLWPKFFGGLHGLVRGSPMVRGAPLIFNLQWLLKLCRSEGFCEILAWNYAPRAYGPGA